MHSTSAISSARASMASAILCSSLRRSSPVVRDQPVRNACVAAFAARVDLGGAAARDLRDHRVVDRRMRLEGLARTALHRLAGNEMPDGAALELCEVTAGLVDIGGKARCALLFASCRASFPPGLDDLVQVVVLETADRIDLDDFECQSQRPAGEYLGRLGLHGREVCSAAFCRTSGTRPVPMRACTWMKPLSGWLSATA